MPVQGPLVLLQTRYHDPDGVVPPEALVQSIKDAGFSIAALADNGTLRGAPAFLQACAKAGVHPVLGATFPLGPGGRNSNDYPIDVLSLQDSPDSQKQDRQEPVVLLAISRRGYRNLLTILDRFRETGSVGAGFDHLLQNRDGLFMIVGIPGSPLAEVVAGNRPWTSIAWIEPLLKGWPKARLAFGGLYPLGDETRTARILARLKQIPVSLSPIALTVAAYRNENERFWGLVRTLQRGALLKTHGLPIRRVENCEGISRNLQGLTRALRLVEKLSIRESDLSEALACPPPIYPTPRGTDTNSFFWTLVQEAAISTGHIRTPGGKDRLYEEFQYLKQTPWPGIWLILWDLRRRLGLPPGTLRPMDDWIRVSLCAHLLGLVRVDPLRERVPFHPTPAEGSSERGLRIEVEAPMGFDNEIEKAATTLLGEGRAGVCVPAQIFQREDLERWAGGILNRWEELGFWGDRPDTPPPLPAYLRGDPDRSPSESFNLLLSGAPLGHLIPAAQKGFPYLNVDIEDATRLGATVFRFHLPPSQTLAAAGRYRGEPEASAASSKRRTETITDWVEEHRGETFQGEAYADDTGKLDLLGYSSCLLRLLTFPGSVAYRPILSEWIRRAAPRNLGSLANLLALGWRWSFWSGRRDWKAIAASRRNPLALEERRPPWWPEWEQFLEASTLGSRLAGSFGAALEKASEPTGGWLLFQEQLVGAVEEGLGLSAAESQLWLGSEDLDESEDGAERRTSKIWSGKAQRAFQVFLGGTAKFPPRVEFLKKAEALLAAAEGFHRDPVAATALLSLLFEEESHERRELYEILKERGKRIALPNLPDAAPFDRSENREALTLGLLNVLGIGPRIAEVLAPEWEACQVNPKQLFERMTLTRSASWSEWLAERARRPVDWKNLTRLIQLGVCEGFGENREVLVEKARRMLRKRSESGGAIQQTLFGLAGWPSVSEAEEEKAWDRCVDVSYSPLQAELDSLRFSADGTPIELYGDAIPSRWKGDEKGRNDTRWAWGWVHEVDLFEAPNEEKDGALPRIWMTFRLFGPSKSYRIADRSGRLAECFPEALPEEIGWEGKRVHLKTVWSLVCEIHRPPAPGAPEFECFDLVDAEPVDEIVSRTGAWAGIEARLHEATPQLQSALEEILDCFAHTVEQRSIPLAFEVSEGVFRKGPLRRLAGRFANVRVVGSGLLARALARLPGIEEVRTIPSQEALFPQK